MTGPEIADRLEVDVRTVRRYIEKLQDVGIPVEASSGRYGGYRLRPGFKIPPLVFTEEEASAIIIGLLGSTRLGLDVTSAAVSAAVSKITRVMPEATRTRVESLSQLLVVGDEDVEPRPDWNLVIELSQAVHSRQVIAITYTAESGATTERVVEPYSLATLRRRWYLIAYCRLRTDMRSFRLDRIRKSNPLASTFEPDPKFDCRAYVSEHLQRYTGGLPYSVVFQTDAETLASRVRNVEVRLTETENGTRLDAFADNFTYEARWLAGIGVPFRVLEPEELRRSVAALGAELLEAGEPVSVP